MNNPTPDVSVIMTIHNQQFLKLLINQVFMQTRRVNSEQ